MARAAQGITSSYANISRPSNPFTQVNLSPNKTEGVTSYDNAEMVETLSEVYHYAQQEASLLMPLFDMRDMTALFHDQDTFNKVQFVQKTEEAPYTPLYVPSGGTRSYSLLQFHQGIQISPTIDAIRRYSLMPKAQMELSKALGRLYDKGIMWAITQSVLQKSSVAANSFQGVPTTSVVALPNSSKYVVGSVSSGTASYDILSTAVFDDIIQHFENLSVDPMNLWVIGSPHLRRKLKTISDFRNNERSIVFNGRENARYINWNDLNFAFMGPETIP